MRALLFLGLCCCFEAACSSDGGEVDAAADAGIADVGIPDSGLGSTSCGSATCTEDQYCQIDPTGACTSAIGQACGAAEESCRKGDDAGCTTPRMRACRPLPAACPNAQCACLINQNLCPNQVLAMCRRPTGEGATIECP